MKTLEKYNMAENNNYRKDFLKQQISIVYIV